MCTPILKSPIFGLVSPNFFLQQRIHFEAALRLRLPLCCSARKPGMLLSFSGYRHSWRQVDEQWRNTTVNRSWGLGVGSWQAAAAKALSSANDNPQRPPSPSRNILSSDKGRFDGGGSNSLTPMSNCCSRSTTSTPSIDGSVHSLASSGRQGKSINRGPSVLGLDEIINKKRDARTMLERVVHIEVWTINCPCRLPTSGFNALMHLKTNIAFSLLTFGNFLLSGYVLFAAGIITTMTISERRPLTCKRLTDSGCTSSWGRDWGTRVQLSIQSTCHSTGGIRIGCSAGDSQQRWAQCRELV